jgi:hypothetical protein
MPITRRPNGVEILHANDIRSRAAHRASSNDDPDLRVVDDATRDIGDVLLSLNSSLDGIHKLEAAFRRWQVRA